ncbi:MAG: hypothetical protein KGM17_10770 [Sphingomonadales bacterium]|nr:hypothetical protein [Sphingomonadales bacterium]
MTTTTAANTAPAILPPPPLPPTPPPVAGTGAELESVRIADSFFSSVDGALVALVFIVALTLIARVVKAVMLHATIRKAIESDSPHAAEMIARLNQPAVSRRRPGGDGRAGIVLTAIGLAMAAFGALTGQQETLASAVFPLFVGIGLLIHLRLSTRAARRDEDAA